MVLKIINQDICQNKLEEENSPQKNALTPFLSRGVIYINYIEDILFYYVRKLKEIINKLNLAAKPRCKVD